MPKRRLNAAEVAIIDYALQTAYNSIMRSGLWPVVMLAYLLEHRGLTDQEQLCNLCVDFHQAYIIGPPLTNDVMTIRYRSLTAAELVAIEAALINYDSLGLRTPVHEDVVMLLALIVKTRQRMRLVPRRQPEVSF